VSRTPEDWAGVGERLLAGDRVALLRVTRLIVSLLVRWRAYDFRDEWPDLVQDVLLAVVAGVRKGSVRNPDALVGYVATVARYRLVDRLRALGPRRRAGDLAWPEATEAAPERDPLHPPVEDVVEVRLLLEKLPEKQRTAVVGVYMEGGTYEAVARAMGIPLGTMKGYLREGLAALRRELVARE
jgi:RNA polymerase sigma-70 factor (ECF subfamily)